MSAPSPAPTPPSPYPEAEKPKDLWYVGAIINVVGSIMINLGTNIMKLGHNKRALLDMPEDQKPPIRKFKEWVFGMVIFSVGNVLNFVSFGFAAQSLLAALGSVQFVSNVIFAGFVLKEQITMVVIIATTCIVGGCVLLVVFGNQSSDTYTVEQLKALYREPAYIVYLTMMGVFVFGSYIVYLHGKKVCNQKGASKFWFTILPVAYSIFSALLGTQSVLFSKSLSVLLRTTFGGDNQLGNWYTWVVLPVFIFTAVFWVTRLNKGLRMFPAMIIVPIMQIAWTLFSIVSGMLYFQEYKGFTTLKAVMFPVGVLVVFAGVVLLTLGQKHQTEEDEQDDPSVPGDKTTVHDNALFHRTIDERDPDIPQKRGGLDTLRFTSLATTTGANIKDLIQAEAQKRRAKEAELNATATSSALDTTYNPALGASNRSQLSTTDRGSMLDTVRKNLRTWREHMRTDFGVDGKSSVKMALGLGDSEMPAVSLFSMPFDMGPKRTSKGASMRYNEMALPRSRFYGNDTEDHALPSIREGSMELPRTASGYDIEAGAYASDLVQRSAGSDPTMPATDAATPGSPQHPSHFGTSSSMVRPSPLRATSSMAADAFLDQQQRASGSGGPSVAAGGSAGAQRFQRMLDLAVDGMERAAKTAVGGVEKAVGGVEKAAKTGIGKLKSAPSDIHRAVLKSKGYGALGDDDDDDDDGGGAGGAWHDDGADESSGLLKGAAPSDASPSLPQQQRRQ